MNLAANKTAALFIVAAGALVSALVSGCASSGRAPLSGQATSSGTGSAAPAATGAQASGAPSGSAPGTATPNGSTAAPATTAPGSTQATPVSNAQADSSCATSGLSLSQGATGAAAGSMYFQIKFTNTSGATCTLYGYPGVALTTSRAPGSQVGAAASKSADKPQKLVTIKPGATALAQVQLVDVLNYPTATCEPAAASYLQVYPPGQTAPMYLPFAAKTCTKPVFALGVTPVYSQ